MFLTKFQTSAEFLLFLHQYEIMKGDFQRFVGEARDLQAQLDDQTQQTITLDRKLTYARKMLEQERKARRDVENEKNQLVRIEKQLDFGKFLTKVFHRK